MLLEKILNQIETYDRNLWIQMHLCEKFVYNVFHWFNFPHRVRKVMNCNETFNAYSKNFWREHLQCNLITHFIVKRQAHRYNHPPYSTTHFTHRELNRYENMLCMGTFSCDYSVTSKPKHLLFFISFCGNSYGWTLGFSTREQKWMEWKVGKTKT